MEETIEILPVSLLDTNRPTVGELKKLAKSLHLELGWHYLLDLTWIIQRLEPISGKHILDAGAGTGILQWHLAERGARVLSVDRASRADLPLRFRRRYHVNGLRPEDLLPYARTVRIKLNASSKLSAKTITLGRDLISTANPHRSPGKVIILNQDLMSLGEVASGSIDAVAAVSALEHNTPENLRLVVSELMRVLKPGGVLLATLVAARDENWFHEPSHAWCYTDASLRQIFDLPSDTPSNYSSYDKLMTELRECSELRDNLASFYFRSSQSGMPWGKWDPDYQPVGVCKIKPGGSKE